MALQVLAPAALKQQLEAPVAVQAFVVVLSVMDSQLGSGWTPTITGFCGGHTDGGLTSGTASCVSAGAALSSFGMGILTKAVTQSFWSQTAQ